MRTALYLLASCVVMGSLAACGSSGTAAPATSPTSTAPTTTAAGKSATLTARDQLAPYCADLTHAIGKADPVHPTPAQVQEVKRMLEGSGIRQGTTGEVSKNVESYYTDTTNLAIALYAGNQAQVTKAWATWTMAATTLTAYC